MSRWYTSPRASAAQIAYDVVIEGRSVGWRGDEESVKAIEAILSPLGIFYACDLAGEWRARKVSP